MAPQMFLLLALVAIVVAPDVVESTVTRLYYPQVQRGKDIFRVDFCYKQKNFCGQPAADEVCRQLMLDNANEKWYTRAVGWSKSSTGLTVTTLALGDEAHIAPSPYGGVTFSFDFIDCDDGEGEIAPVDWPTWTVDDPQITIEAILPGIFVSAPIDYCVRLNKYGCGRPAADHMCRVAGYAYASNFVKAAAKVAYTVAVYDAKIACNEPDGCDTFSSITCIGGRVGYFPPSTDLYTVHNPESPAGGRLDFCYKYGEYCGWPAADGFCRYLGYSAAHTWDVAPGVSPTRMIGDNGHCSGSFCDGFASITCLQQDSWGQSIAAPAVNGHPLDNCYHWASSCGHYGDPAADGWCKAAGYKAGFSAGTEPVLVGQSSMVLGDNKLCTSSSTLHCMKIAGLICYAQARYL